MILKAFREKPTQDLLKFIINILFDEIFEPGTGKKMYLEAILPVKHNKFHRHFLNAFSKISFFS